MELLIDPILLAYLLYVLYISKQQIIKLKKKIRTFYRKCFDKIFESKKSVVNVLERINIFI